jgi:hypothetical protein
MGGSAKTAIWRVRRLALSAGICPLTQREVAVLMDLSERAVREIEHRAVQKLRNDPRLREVWRQYLAGELDEEQSTLTREEIKALFNLAVTQEEWRVIEKVLRLIQR